MAEDYLIVGAGEAGVAAAAAIRARAPASRIRLVSDEPGFPYERPPLSKNVLTGDPVPTLLRQPEWYAENRVELVEARATSIDAGNRRVAVTRAGAPDEALTYDALLIATGAQARLLPFTDVLHLRRWDDALKIRERLGGARHIAVVGGGVIGLELASSARALGREVVVIELADRLMARALAPDVGAWLLDIHRAAGVDVRLSAGVAGIESGAGGHEITLADGSALSADLVLAGIGAAPDTRLAAEAGCAIDDGILVDARGRTSVEGIYAAGDGARFYHPDIDAHMRLEAWQHAGRHGAHVGNIMAGGDDDYRCTPWFWTDQHGINLQVAGLASEADHSVWRGDGPKRIAFHMRGDRLVAASTIDNGRDMRPAMQLIEAGWTGDAADLADESVTLRALVQATREPVTS